MLDPGSTTAMPAPGVVAQDAIASKHGRDELGDAAVATVGQNAPMLSAQSLDVRVPVMDDIVAMARTAAGRGDDAQIAAAREDLGVA